jgi:3-methylcrotonyl-CoA carboxylase alpha subunit
MEAMKMEHTITAPSDGTVRAILYAVGEQVAEGAELLDFAPDADAP